MRFAHKMALTAFVAALLSSAAMASSALATTPEWYAATTAEWQQGGVALSEAVPVVWKGTIEITAGESHEPAVECEDKGEGTVGPGAAGTQTAWTFSNCKSAICEKTPGMTATTVPWSTELTTSAGTIEDQIKEGSKGSTGFQYQCQIVGIKLTHSCPGILTARMTNNSSGVTAALSGEKLSCTNGGGVSTVAGTQTMEATKGGKLEVKAPFTKLTKSLEATTGSKFNITNHGILNIKCENSTLDGTIGTAGKGTISGTSLGQCGGKPECESVTLEPVNLPWNTELYTNESGGISDKIVSGGSGTPEFKIECDYHSVRTSFTCGINTNASLFNEVGEGDVLAEFREGISSETSCGATKAQWSGDLTIRPTNDDPLEVVG